MFLSFLKPNHQVSELKKYLLPDCKRVLDVGFGKNSTLRFLIHRFNQTVGVDLFDKDLTVAKKLKTHSKLINLDVRNVNKIFPPKSFDGVIAMDVVEHLTKNDAHKLIRKMEIIAKKIVIIGTPNSFVPQKAVGGNIYQIHKCGFTTKEFKGLGYNVKGMDGPKILRGEGAEIRFQPKALFAIISNLLDPLLRNFPELNYSLFAYKKI